MYVPDYKDANSLRLSNKMPFVWAIAWEEGFWSGPHTRAARNHNPGNIEHGKFAVAHGAIAFESNLYAVFATDIDGFLALQALLKSAYVGKPIMLAINRYAPPSENPTGAYINNICVWTGKSQSDVLTEADFEIPEELPSID